MNTFLRRFLMNYGIYRRYPMGLLPAICNAWRTARPEFTMARSSSPDLDVPFVRRSARLKGGRANGRFRHGGSARRLPSIGLINLILGDGGTRMGGENSGCR
jgi:hypothetical protein